MVKKCCVYGCTTNYLSKTRKRKTDEDDTTASIESIVKPSVYRFPKDPIEREEWRKVVPNENLNVTDNTVICSIHWPPDFEKIGKNGKFRPKNKPSVWPKVPSSQIPTVPAPQRSTSKSLSSARNEQPDELSSFLESDKVEFITLKDYLDSGTRSFCTKVTSFLMYLNIRI